MGSADVAPSTAPAWLVPASTVTLGIGVSFWLITYILMTRRSLETGFSPVPLLALGVNLAWEVTYAAYVCDMPLEICGFALWLLLDIPVTWATLRTAPRSFAKQPLVARNANVIVILAFVWGVAANLLFAWWWLREPHRGYGLKWGKAWKGLEARDTTELAFWSAGAAQLLFSAGALAMLIQRGHSGGASYGIWLCRFIGTYVGLPGTSILLWWHWPEAHGYVFQPLSLIIVGTALLCDVVYPFVLAYVRQLENIPGSAAYIAMNGEKLRKED